MDDCSVGAVWNIGNSLAGGKKLSITKIQKVGQGLMEE